MLNSIQVYLDPLSKLHPFCAQDLILPVGIDDSRLSSLIVYRERTSMLLISIIIYPSPLLLLRLVPQIRCHPPLGNPSRSRLVCLSVRSDRSRVGPYFLCRLQKFVQLCQLFARQLPSSNSIRLGSSRSENPGHGTNLLKQLGLQLLSLPPLLHFTCFPRYTLIHFGSICERSLVEVEVLLPFGEESDDLEWVLSCPRASEFILSFIKFMSFTLCYRG